MSDDLRALIAAFRGALIGVDNSDDIDGWLAQDSVMETTTVGAFRALLNAAERSLTARNAALEEAAAIAEACDPDRPRNWLHPRHKIAFEIRALKDHQP